MRVYYDYESGDTRFVFGPHESEIVEDILNGLIDATNDKEVIVQLRHVLNHLSAANSYTIN